MMMRKRNKRKYHLRIAAVMILLLAITNTATYRITEQYIQGKENVKEIAYKGSNTVSIKNVTKKLNPASFKIDRQLVKQIKNVMIIAHPDDETLWAGDHIMKDRYLIICLTNGNNKIRKKEFEKAMELTGNYGIILNLSLIHIWHATTRQRARLWWMFCMICMRSWASMRKARHR